MKRKMMCSCSLAAVAFAAFLVCGCSDPQEATNSKDPAPGADSGHQSAHEHPTEGPHGGELIELGNEEYHAELLHPHHHDDDADAHEGDKDAGHKDENHEGPDHDHAGVTVYILDGSAKKAVPIEAAEIAINLKHDGKGEQFKLAAMPTKDDPEGKSSRFASDDKDLLEHFHEEEIEGTLVLEIGGKSYRGKIEHDHDHDEDEHPEGDHDKDEHHKGDHKD